MLEIDGEADVELAAGEVVGDGVLDVVDVCHPIVAAYIADVKEVEYIKAEPRAFDVP